MASDSTTLDHALAERERVLRILQEEAPRLRALGITHLSLFGSMAQRRSRTRERRRPPDRDGIRRQARRGDLVEVF